MRTTRLTAHRPVLQPGVLAVLALLIVAPAIAQTPKAAASSAPAKAHTAMDLKPPPLTHIYPRGELQYILAVDDSSLPDNVVSVKGAKRAVVVPGTPGNQLQAIPWAFMHPTDAWRIFTPLQEP